MVSNAHASRTPHHVGQIEKARIEIAAICDGAPYPEGIAARIVDALLDLGWTPPRDPNADLPPLRPDQPAGEHSPARQALRAQLCQMYGHPADSTDTCSRCATPLNR